jgi:Domain of unknown function (DUF6249)
MREELLALFIPILGIVFGIGVAIVAIIAGHREKVKRAELRHRERLAALEKGIELPPEPDFDAANKRAGSLRGGVMGLLVGIVLYFALRAVADEDVALFGLIPAAVGIANLVSYFVERPGKDDGGGLKRNA